jgi:Tfp pilus assembly protein PilP
MRLLRLWLVVAVLISTQVVRARTLSQHQPAKPAPVAQGRAAAPAPATPRQSPVPPPPAAPAKPGVTPLAAAPKAEAKPAAAPAATTGQGPAAAPAPTASKPPPPDAYVYRSEGRRDPFLSVIGTGEVPRDSSRKADGPTGLSVNEISVRGIMQSKGALVAMIQGPDRKTFIVHQGDKLLDGTIKTITPQGLIVMQEVNDPLSLVKQREVRKLLRSLEDSKE